MSDLKHTPERWFWTETSDDRPQMLMRSLNGGAPDYVLTPQADISDYGLGVNFWIDISKNDARLIAAAPQLLEALKQIANGEGVYGAQAGEYKAIARAAIAAAEGDA